MRKSFNFWLVFLLCLIPAYFYGVDNALSQTAATDLTFSDHIDSEILVQGLERTSNFGQTLSWWHGTWLAGDAYPFYRPLTSLIWWGEFQAFGATRYSRSAMIGFMAIHWLSHFTVCLLLGGLLRRLFGDRIAILTVVIWAAGLINLLSLPVPLPALAYWKDSPDLWVAASAILSLWSLLSYLRTGQLKFVAGVFAAQLVAISFKELSYVLPFMALVLVWFEHKNLPPEKRRGWSIIAGMFGVIVVAYAFRWWALGGPGFRFGTNGSWFSRFILNMGGGKAEYRLLLGDPTYMALISVIIAGFYYFRRPSRPHVAAIYATIGVLGFLLADLLSDEWGTTFYRLLLPVFSSYLTSAFELYSAAISGALFICIAIWAWEKRDRRFLFAWGLGFAAYLPLLTAPLTDHALYLCSMGIALYFSIAFAHVPETLLQFLQSKRSREIKTFSLQISEWMKVLFAS